jgi:alpha-L-rhamnosidase
VAQSALGQGRHELDFGRNLTGWLRLRLRGLAAGDEIVIRYYDKKPFTPMQNYAQLDRFISAGRPEEEFRSKFNYHGFRWAVIEGLPAAPRLEDAEAEVLAADWETAGSFECSNERFNRMHEVNLWTIRMLSQSGFISDCPHRERLGYGDGQVSIESCAMNFQMQPFYDKWAQDWFDGVNPDGYLPHTAPQYKSGGGGPGWGGAGQALTWRNHLYFGDRRILERHLDKCLGHIRAIESRGGGGDVVRAYGGQWDFIGDWVPPGRGMDTNNWPPKPAAELFNNCYRLHLREQWAKMADILGRHEEAAVCRKEMERMRAAVHEAFYDPENERYVLDEQSYHLMPLMTGVVPEELRPRMLEKLEECIRVKRKGHLDTGMLGTYFLLQYLQEIGRNDLLFEIVNQTTYPGWGYMLEQGATTWWEQWNGHWSQIHSCFTSLDGWFYQGLAGIRPDPTAPGFKRIVIKPAIVGDLTWVKCHHDSPYGRIVSNWRLDPSTTLRAGGLTMEVEIPPNTTATVHVPAKSEADVTESGAPAAQAKALALSSVEGVKFLRMEHGAAVFEVGSGNYKFSSILWK